ncbi:MAG: class I SAM-dependent methyltransferase [Anaerolineales bacterium]
MGTLNSSSYIGGELDIFAEAVRWKAYFGRLLRPYLGERVLEVGAGLGATTAALCSGREREWWCLEPDPALLAHIEARLRTSRLPPCCRAVPGALQDVPASARFDTILYIDVLEHIEDDRAELERAAARLLPGGHLIVLAPACPALYSPFDRAIGHYRRYTRAALQALTPPQTRLIVLRHLDSLGFFLSLANRSLLRQSMPSRRQILFWDRLLTPLTRLSDWLVRYTFGRSLLAVWEA